MVDLSEFSYNKKILSKIVDSFLDLLKHNQINLCN